MSRNTLLMALAFAAVLSGRGAAASAQMAADARYLTIDAQHVRVTYEDGLEPLARHTAAAAERAFAALQQLVADPPGGPVDIVIADNVDYTSGYATLFPSNRIVLHMHAPVDQLELAYMQDWIELVVTHELAHLFHLDQSSGFGDLVRTIFGRIPAPWPVYSAVFTPQWSIEGLATAVESAVTGYGRVHGSYHEMIVRTASLEDEIDSMDRLRSTSPRWPGAPRVYIYGSLFMDYLARRYGPDAAARIVRNTANAAIPTWMWFDGVGQSTFGMTFREAYDDWREELDTRYAALAARLRAEGVTATQVLTSHHGEALFPRWSPDGTRIAYAAGERKRPPRTRVIDAVSRRELWSRRRNFMAPSSWLPDHTLLTSDLDYVDRFRVYSDVWVMSEHDEEWVTRAARLTEADTRDGATIVAVQQDAAVNRLVLVDAAGRITRELTAYDPAVLWSMPRFSPTGDRIAVARWRRGVSDIVVMDLGGRILLETGGGAGLSGAPAWTPDGQWLLFWSDRTGIPNIYATELQTRALRQVTNVLTGAFHPDVSPDGQWLAFSAYHHDGYRIEAMRMDPSQWRTPQPAQGRALTERPSQHVAATSALADSVRTAAAAADTTSGAPYRYRPVRHMRPYAWLPLLEGDGGGSDYFGIRVNGSDLVERHAWDLGVTYAPKTGRTQGAFGYSFRGLPTLASGLHPVVSVAVQRDWDRALPPDSAGTYVDEREDVGALLLSFTRSRVRVSSGFAIGAEAVRRSRGLYDADPRRRLCDPQDDLFGLRGSLYYARYSGAPYSISRENGLSLQLSGRRRWDRDAVTCRVSATREVTIDAGYSEMTTWNTAYRALPLPGFARHVIAARLSGLFRSGPGAGFEAIGGVNTSGLAIPGVDTDFAGTGRLLPLRGVEDGVRFGTRAWTASLEYRFPLARVERSLRPIPMFFDRISGAGFLDAGHAWCSREAREATSFAACPSISFDDTPIASAGAETTLWLSAFNLQAPVRIGGAIPFQGVDSSRARFYVVGGVSF